MKKKLVIDLEGNVRHIYDDGLIWVGAALGKVEVKRASHVEPTDGGWGASMALVGGPLLGPFATRAEALEAESRWLEDNNIPEV